jgi:hypothetical protein
LSVPRNGAPDCPVCHRTVSGAPGPYNSKSHSRVSRDALRYNSSDCPMCHRTVRCTSGATAKSRNGRLCKGYSALQCTPEVRGAPDSEQDLSGVAPDCPVPHEDKASNGQLLPNPNSWVTWRRTGQSTGPVRWRIGLSGAPIDSNLHQRPFGG